MLWILRPCEKLPEWNPWNPWYDRCFGMVVRATSATEARAIAAKNASNEKGMAWIDESLSTCKLVEADGESEVIIEDMHNA